MKSNVKNILWGIIVFVTSFFTSFYSLDYVYFILSFELIIFAMCYKGGYFFIGMLGMILASLFINVTHLTDLLIGSYFLTYFSILLLRKLNINIKCKLGIIATFFGFLMSFGQFLINKNVMITSVFLVPLSMFAFAYYLAEFHYDLKSKETFSLTRKEVILLSVMLNVILGTIFIGGEHFYLHFILFTLLNYLIIKVDRNASVIGVFVGFILSIYYSAFELSLLFMINIFGFKITEKKYYISILIYLLVCFGIMNFYSNYEYLFELLTVAIFMIFFPKNSVYSLQKYIVDPKDYELKLIQRNYYKTLGHNQKIKRIMEILETYLKNNPRMKKHTHNIILDDLDFLRNKLNEEENIHLKDMVINELKYQKTEILSLKIECDIINNYKINLELKDNELSWKEIKKIIERQYDVILKLENYHYNYLLGISSFVFINDEKVDFSVSIKQRSKDLSDCGDSYMSFKIKNKKYILISDGMGHGKKAAKDSSVFLFLLKSFIELGMEVEKAIISANALLLQKEGEKFNTLDLLEYDIKENKISLFKNGSGATYLKRGERVEKIQSENLPLGIIENIKTKRIDIDVDSDYIILTSDGIKSELSELLLKTKAKVSKYLINEIFKYEGDKIEDDQTIVAINVIKN